MSSEHMVDEMHDIKLVQRPYVNRCENQMLLNQSLFNAAVINGN